MSKIPLVWCPCLLLIREMQAKAQEVAGSEALGRHSWKVSGSKSERRATGDIVEFLRRDEVSKAFTEI